MRVGLLVDGMSEFYSLKLLKAQLGKTGVSVVGPAKVAIQPYATPVHVAKACESRIKLLEGQVDTIVLIIDREDLPTCPPALAAVLTSCLSRFTDIPCAAVIKDTRFENWLIADVDALLSQPARFRLSRATRRSIAPDKADHIDALTLLKDACLLQGYDKVADSKRILARADVGRIAGNSRSFRRFLRVLGHTSYLGQSRLP